MTKKLLILVLLAVVVTVSKKAKAQEPSDRKISIEITTTEDGNTTTKKIDLDNATEAEIEAAMEELGVMEHFMVNDDDGNVVIDIRRFGDEEGEGDRNVHMRMVPSSPFPPGASGIPTERSTWLGVNTESLNSDLIKSLSLPVKEGVHVLEVIDNSPASKAGLQKGDVITAVEGDQITDPASLSATIKGKKAGEKVKITVYRDSKKQHITAELAERETSYSYHYNDGDGHHLGPHGGEGNWKEHLKHMREPRAFLGVTPGDAEKDTKGAVIGSVEDGSAAQRMGLLEGDVIRSLNGVAIEDFGALSRKVGSMKPGEKVTIQVDRNGNEQELTGEFGERSSDIRWMSGDEDFEFNFEGFGEAEQEELREEMDNLREEMDRLREDLGHELRSQTRIHIEGRKLTEEERTLLKGKGVKGLENELELSNLTTFPNPSNGFFRIQFEVAEKADLNVDVHDASGERVYEEK
ncbi:MAG: PDZ domain-containing protein, partial [Bacteroidota bacterium]|nr:PDZ domain-containing protein [Bacteroidota bacterium]